MFTVKINGTLVAVSEEVAIKEWMKGYRVYDKDGREATGIECGVTGEFFIYD